MAPMSCSDFQNAAESWPEGGGSPEALAHLRDCAACRSLAEDFSAIRGAASEFPAELDPPEHLWASLRSQLETEGLIHAELPPVVAPAASASPGWFAGLGAWLRGSAWGVPRPVFAAGYLAILVALGFSLSGPIHRHVVNNQWLEGTQTSAIDAQLTTVAQNTAALPIMNPAVTASLHENLAIVDNYIALCEKSVREEPQNEIARDYLYDAYQQKAYLLAQMNERGD
jgi:hypothetical protein